MNTRTYPVPKSLREEFNADITTLDEMEMISLRHTPAGSWAAKVLARENDKTLDSLLGESNILPMGAVLASALENGDEIVTHLVNKDGQLWAGQEWFTATDRPEHLVLLASSDVAYIARAFKEGAEAVLLSHSAPLAFIAASTPQEEEAPGGSDVPEGAVPVAIVDSLHNDAVLELLAVAPGPKVFRRHAGDWYEDPGWVAILASVNPPSMVKLEPDQVSAVEQQIDAATSGEFKPTKANDASVYRPIRASSEFVQEIQDETLDKIIEFNLGLLAVAGRELSPKDYANTERLRRYWLYGRGAAKIRWFTPGSWRRCYRHLVKYLGPRMTPGYCTNLSQRLGGPGVATHVGSRRG